MFIRCSVYLFVLFVFSLTPQLGGVWAKTVPLSFKFNNVQSSKEKYHTYGALKDLKTYHYGEYWEIDYKFSNKLSSDERFSAMEKVILKQLDNPSFSFGKYGYLEFEAGTDEYVMQLKAYGKKATLKLLKNTTYRPFLTLNMDHWPLSPRLADKVGDVPLVSIAPFAEELEISRLQYKKYEEKVFRAGKQTLDGKGQYWSVEYKLKKNNKANLLRYRAAQNYFALLKKEGADISLNGDDGTSYIFALDYENQHFVGWLQAYDSSLKLQIIAEETFQQSLVLSPDKLKAELEASGKVTLEGVYFDTDKATLKPESDPAILAAASLLKHYSDLVLEVQGHTDSQGDDKYNLDLSSRRAASVVAALVVGGVEKERLVAKGFGEQVPVADNSTAEGRAENRRVELHRLSGGDEVMMIDIDFIKPLPNAVTEAERHYGESELTVYFAPPYSESKHVEKVSVASYDVYSYLIEKNGKRDSSVSPTEILANYRHVLPLLGATLVGQHQNNLHFYFADRGDKRPLYGVISAYAGSYEVKVGTVKAEAVKPAQAKKIAANNNSCTADIVGEYHADYKGSKAYNTEKSYAFVTNGVIEGGSNLIILKKDGSARMEGSKEGYDLTWKLAGDLVLLQQDEMTVREIKCLNGDSFSVSMDILGTEPTVVLYCRQ